MRTEDEAAYVEYAEGRALSLRRTAYRLCGDWQLAEDLAQQALIKLFVHWRRARRADNLDAYARQILVRTWLDELRRPWRRATPVAQLPETAARDGDDPATRLALVAALAKVAPRQRAVLVLRFWEGMSVAEAADTLNCSTGTVKSQTSAGLNALRRVMPNAARDFAGVSEGGDR
jgi:RNA polymerase sigma-70 factor (sigma-E family)